MIYAGEGLLRHLRLCAQAVNVLMGMESQTLKVAETVTEVA